MNFLLRFLLNLSITPLPADELNELCAQFHAGFVCCSQVKNLSVIPLPTEPNLCQSPAIPTKIYV